MSLHRPLFRFLALTAVSVLMPAFGIGCANESAPDDDVDESVSDLTSKQKLESEGFVFKRRERFEYSIQGPSVATGMACVGGPPPNDRICYSLLEDGESKLVKGSAARYEHADGRVAYVKGKSIIGPVKPGTYLGTMEQELRRGDRIDRKTISVTVRLLDLSLGEKGEFPLAVEFATDAWVRQPDMSYAEEHPGWSVLVPWTEGKTFGSNGAKVGDGIGERVQLAQNGTIARFDVAIAQDEYSLERAYVSAVDPPRSPATCATPYQCMKHELRCTYECHDEVYENAVFADKDACEAGCGEIFRNEIRPNVECRPAVKACL